MNLKQLINKALKPPPKDFPVTDYYAPYYHLMHLLSRQIKNGLLVELGVESGRGILSMSHSGNLIIGVDSHKHPNIDSVVASDINILFKHQASMPVPYSIAMFATDSNYRGIDLLHIDTEHSYSMAKAEFEAYSPFLANGAYVLFDDLHAQEDDVLRYFNELPYEKLQDDRLHPSCGYGIMIYET